MPELELVDDPPSAPPAPPLPVPEPPVPLVPEELELDDVELELVNVAPPVPVPPPPAPPRPELLEDKVEELPAAIGTAPGAKRAAAASTSLQPADGAISPASPTTSQVVLAMSPMMDLLPPPAILGGCTGDARIRERLHR